MDKAQEHNSWFDWLRFVAALAVLLTHARDILFVQFSQLEESSRHVFTMVWVALTRQGHEAVVVFFVLSGFLVGGPALARARAGQFRPGDYVLDRVVRIIVPLVPAVALTVLGDWWRGRPMGPADVLGSLLSVQGVLTPVPASNTPLWSLTYEVWFYVLGGAVAFLISTRSAWRLLPWVLIGFAVALFAHLKLLYVAIWFLGAFAFLLRPMLANGVVIAGGVLAALGGVAVHQIAMPNAVVAGAESGQSLWMVMGEILLSVGVAIVLAHVSALKTNSRTAFARIGTFLAGFSYSLYLVHMPLLYMQPIKDAKVVSAATFAYYLVTLASTLVFAFLFSRAFEATGPALKKLLRRRLAGQVTA